MIYKRKTIQSVKGYSFIFILYERERERKKMDPWCVSGRWTVAPCRGGPWT